MSTLSYVIETLEALVNIPSPSGFTKEVMEFVAAEVEKMGYESHYTNRRGLIVQISGESNTTIGLSAHVDTLGAMVRSINADGTINFTQVGGFTMQSIEGSYCKLHTRTGKEYTGTILCKSPSVHSYDDASTLERTEQNMMIRLDELVESKDEVEALEINSGDYVSFDPEFAYTKSGFVKSRHLDDKASVAVLLGLLKDIKEERILPAHNIKLLISNYEEVGFGASFLPEDIVEMLAVDMGAMGDDLNGSETKVSICAKDSSGPYDYEMTNRLIKLAQERNIPYAVDVFPHYGSDVSAALRGGNNIRGALIGQGVNASHGMERTHEQGLMATLQLLKAYIQ